MTRKQRFYILTQNGLGAALVNALLNGAIGWGLTRGLAGFPVWRAPGVAMDLVFTAFGITFGTCLVLPSQIRRDFERGRATLPRLSARVRTFVDRFPRRFFARGLVLGALSIPVFAPPVLVALLAHGAPSLSRLAFVELKALFSAVQGGLVTPLVVLAVLSDLTERAAGERARSMTAGAP